MNIRDSIKSLATLLEEKRPETFSSTWIYKNDQSLYNFLRLNFRTENNNVDWDGITGLLSREFQKKWVRYRGKYAKPYSRQSEVDAVLARYKSRLYILLSPANEGEKRMQHRIFIRLVRLGQKGNTRAQDELIKWVTFITDDWIDRYPQMYRWKGYTDEIPQKIKDCIRRYRYTGSFLGYLFKTLEYSAFAKPPLYSLDDYVLGGAKTRHEYVAAEQESVYA